MGVVPSGTNYHSKAKSYTDYSVSFEVSMPKTVANVPDIPVSMIKNTLGLEYTYYPPGTSGGNANNLKWPGYVHVKLPAGKWHIVLNGARGGDYGGYRAYGRGARLFVYYDAKTDEDIVITAAARGSDIPLITSDTSAASGGGASFVYSRTTGKFIAIAAGGNGAADIYYMRSSPKIYGENANGFAYLNKAGVLGKFLEGMPITSYHRIVTVYSAFGGALVYDDAASPGGGATYVSGNGVSDAARSAFGADANSQRSCIEDPIAYLLSTGDNASAPSVSNGAFSDDAGSVAVYPNNTPADIMYSALVEAYTIEDIFDYLSKHDMSLIMRMFDIFPENIKRSLAQDITPEFLASIRPKVSYSQFAEVMAYRGELIETLRYFRNSDTLSLFEF